MYYKSDLHNLFGGVIFSYTRKNALDDGVLIDVSNQAVEAGFKIPVAVTQSVWSKYIVWSDTDSQRQTVQDTEGRLWDILSMLKFFIQKNRSTDLINFSLHVIPRDGKSLKYY